MNAPDSTLSADSETPARTILVVEDKIELRYTLAAWLRMAGYIVLEAATADEAVAILQSSLTVHLVMTDVQMPGSLNGLDLASRISAEFPDIKVIIVSGNTDRKRIPKGIAFFSKPYNLIEISAHIAKLLDLKSN